MALVIVKGDATITGAKLESFAQVVNNRKHDSDDVKMAVNLMGGARDEWELRK